MLADIYAAFAWLFIHGKAAKFSISATYNASAVKQALGPSEASFLNFVLKKSLYR
jgi:hypothetical protein